MDSDVIKGLSECKASKSNFKCIRVKDIIKEIEYYLKKYSSAGMDINWWETQYHLKVRQKISDPISWLYKFTCKLDTLSSLVVQMDSDLDVEEDQRINNEFIADLNAEYHERALLANQKRFYKLFDRVGSARKPLEKTKETCFDCGKLGKKDKEKSEKGLLAESFDWDDESVSSDDEGNTKIRAFIAIAEDEPPVGKADLWVGKVEGKEVVFTKVDESSSILTPEITYDLESESLNMADLTLDTPGPKNTRPSVKVSPAYVIKKKTEKSPADLNPCFDKKVDSSTEQLLLTLIEQPKCSTCGSTDHLTKEHLEHAVVKKTLSKLKAQLPLKPSPKKAPMIPKPFIECKYCGFNDHHSDHYILAVLIIETSQSRQHGMSEPVSYYLID
nr:hypothetical protein [Tanacetum cinerariifolium]